MLYARPLHRRVLYTRFLRTQHRRNACSTLVPCRRNTSKISHDEKGETVPYVDLVEGGEQSLELARIPHKGDASRPVHPNQWELPTTLNPKTLDPAQ